MTADEPKIRTPSDPLDADVPFQFPLGKPRSTVDRRRYLVERAAGRDVVHLGCADERLTRQRAGTGDLLHEELDRVAASLCGVDLSDPALALLAETVPGSYFQGNVEELGAIALPNTCDLVIASELIEHLGRPAAFLEGLNAYLTRTGATALITTPNAYSWKQFATFAASRSESTHPDHVLIYSPVTLRRAMERACLEVVGISVHAWPVKSGPKAKLVGLIDRCVRRWNPWLGTGLVIEVRPQPRR